MPAVQVLETVFFINSIAVRTVFRISVRADVMVPLMLLQLVVVLLLTAVQVFAMVFLMTPIAVALVLRMDVSVEVIVTLMPLH